MAVFNSFLYVYQRIPEGKLPFAEWKKCWPFSYSHLDVGHRVMLSIWWDSAGVHWVPLG